MCFSCSIVRDFVNRHENASLMMLYLHNDVFPYKQIFTYALPLPLKNTKLFIYVLIVCNAKIAHFSLNLTRKLF